MSDRDAIDRAAQESWEDDELLPDMPPDARAWFLAEREKRKKREGRDA